MVKHLPGKSKTSLPRLRKASKFEAPREFKLLNKPLLQLTHCFLLRVKRRLRILIFVDINAVPHQVGPGLRVHASGFLLARKGAPHRLKIDMAKTAPH